MHNAITWYMTRQDLGRGIYTTENAVLHLSVHVFSLFVKRDHISRGYYHFIVGSVTLEAIGHY